MMFDPQIHHRRSIRLKGYDYAQPGAYFVTLVTNQREEIFGEVAEGKMRLNPLGEIVREEWLKTAEIRSNLELHGDEYIIMPNHVHGIIRIVETQPVRATHGSIESKTVGATRRVAPTNEPHTLVPNSIGAIMAQFKSITAKRINTLRDTRGSAVWQRNYYEHIVRNETEMNNIWNYINTNPLHWQDDQLHPSSPPGRFNQEKL
jgi:putative transposase